MVYYWTNTILNFEVQNCLLDSSKGFFWISLKKFAEMLKINVAFRQLFWSNCHFSVDVRIWPWGCNIFWRTNFRFVDSRAVGIRAKGGHPFLVQFLYSRFDPYHKQWHILKYHYFKSKIRVWNNLNPKRNLKMFSLDNLLGASVGSGCIPYKF